MQQTILFVSIGVIAIAAGMIILPWRHKRRRRKKISAAFGQEPQTYQGLRNAGIFWKSFQKESHLQGYVDDLTWTDLDLDEIYGRINNCQSSLGDVLLYMTLRMPNASPAGMESQLQKRRFFQQNPALRLKVQLLLAQLGRQNGEGQEMLLYHPQTLLLKNRLVCQLLAFAPFASVLVLLISPVAAFIWLAASLLFNMFFSIMLKNKNEIGFRTVRYLASSIGTAKKLAQLLQKELPQQARTLKQTTEAFSGFLRSYQMLAFDELIAQAGFPNPAMMFLLPTLSYAKMAQKLQSLSDKVLALYTAIGELEVAITTLSFQQSIPVHSLPQFIEEAKIEFTALHHPLLQDGVPNSAAFTEDVLITGSNASGKSTFIKAVAINCILAQTLYFCTAHSFALKAGLVATSMAVKDSVVDGDSYFMAEIKSMQRLVQKAEAQQFGYFFIDEILKGTNTIERVAASSAMLGFLHQKNCLCFAPTHDVELTTILEKQFKNYHFSETVTQSGDVLFNYTLQEGRATNRNAILLLQGAKFPTTITEAAWQWVEKFEQKGEWIQLTDNREN